MMVQKRLPGVTYRDKGEVLVDGDIVAYRAAFACQDKTQGEAIRKVDDLMDFILDETIALPFPTKDEYEVFITGEGNFRYEIAKSHPYKGNRKSVEKPVHLEATRQHLVNSYQAEVSSGEEADDLISKRATALGYNCVVASIDKDMLQLPCWHFNFSKENRDQRWTKVSEFEGLAFFYLQILTGDAVDNIKGLHRVGPVKGSKILDGCTTEGELWDKTLEAYGGDLDRVLENARLLWLRRYEGEMWEPPK